MSNTSNLTKVSSFVSHLALHFGAPKFDVPEQNQKMAEGQWLQTMVRSLGGYSQECLDRARDGLITGRKYRSFPLVSEIIEACNKAQRAINEENPRLALGSKGYDESKLAPYAPERERIANELILCPMGRQAAKDGWNLSLWHFIHRNLRLPTDKWMRDPKTDQMVSEIAYCKGIITDADFHHDFGTWDGEDRFSAQKRKEASDLQHALAKLGQSMLKKRDDLAAYVLTGEVR